MSKRLSDLQKLEVFLLIERGTLSATVIIVEDGNDDWIQSWTGLFAI